MSTDAAFGSNEQELFELFVNDLAQKRVGDTRHLELQQEIASKELEIAKLGHFISTGLGGVCAECFASTSSNSVHASQSIVENSPVRSPTICLEEGEEGDEAPSEQGVKKIDGDDAETGDGPTTEPKSQPSLYNNYGVGYRHITIH